MTAKEIADRFCERAYDAGQCERLIKELILRERAEAMEGEREACAKVAEGHEPSIDVGPPIPSVGGLPTAAAIDRFERHAEQRGAVEHNALMIAHAIRTRPTAEQEDTDAT